MAIPQGTGYGLKEEKRPVPLIAVVLAAITLLALIGWLAYINFAPRTSAKPKTANDEWVLTKARETKGEFQRLTPEDQRRLQSIAGRNAPIMLYQTYQMHQAK
jgi:hypothetical protein